MSEPIIEVRNVSKTYHVRKKEGGLTGAIKGLIKKETIPVKAVNNISFTINKGEIVGLIGKNGSGKSTLIKMMTGILQPDISSGTNDVVPNGATMLVPLLIKKI